MFLIHAVFSPHNFDRWLRLVIDLYKELVVAGQYGYDRILRVLGRHLRDFLNGLDNLHEYLRFSYPKLKPPSFFCEDETSEGLTLHYRYWLFHSLLFVKHVKNAHVCCRDLIWSCGPSWCKILGNICSAGARERDFCSM